MLAPSLRQQLVLVLCFYPQFLTNQREYFLRSFSKCNCYGFSRKNRSKGRTFKEIDLSRDLSNFMPSVKSILRLNKLRRTSRAPLYLKNGQLWLHKTSTNPKSLPNCSQRSLKANDRYKNSFNCIHKIRLVFSSLN